MENKMLLTFKTLNELFPDYKVKVKKLELSDNGVIKITLYKHDSDSHNQMCNWLNDCYDNVAQIYHYSSYAKNLQISETSFHNCFPIMDSSLDSNEWHIKYGAKVLMKD